MGGGERGEARNRICCLDCAVTAGGVPGGPVRKESACNAEDTGDTTLGREDPLEEGMATHSSILSWRIPWTEEPGKLYIVHRVTKSQT